MFTLKTETCPLFTLNGSHLPQKDEAKYVSIPLNQRLSWRVRDYSLVLSTRKCNGRLGCRYSYIVIEYTSSESHNYDNMDLEDRVKS